ncbi:DNA-3-methyladenine glycosylase [Cohnella sp. WQ 127256]|uniref:DNA-3-methyladenine glycosylase family protein n=1 Tax=Cohnella sp. WQ 127256 TaxID=2938790 RepID=UPI0021197B5E|nr:DNA-3-methyladenine glycosylase [Cohnella sp. WQ 127256]
MLNFKYEEITGCTLVDVPYAFSYNETLLYLTRSTMECLHHVENRHIYKLIEIEHEPILIEISESDASTIWIRLVDSLPRDRTVWESIVHYVQEWFDLHRDLAPFYHIAANDPLLSKLATDYYGMRIIGVPDLFEALCWAVIGQQINLTFAYTLKKRFVEAFGKPMEWNSRTYWLFPKPEDVASILVDDLKKLQFTSKKAEYIIHIAQLMQQGELSKHALLSSSDFKAIESQLITIRGIGPWTANYVLMRCFRDPSAFPIGDAALQTALKLLLNRSQKPSLDEIKQLFFPWKEWEAYAVFYLWRSLTPVDATP